MRAWVQYCAITPLALLLASPGWADGSTKQPSADFKKKCAIRVHWNFEQELSCQGKFSEAQTPAFCSRLLFIEGEHQCVITTKPKLTHDTLGEAVRSCLVQLPESCR